jgi:hypothetical protein
MSARIVARAGAAEATRRKCFSRQNPPPYVGAHEKRGQDKLSQQRRPGVFRSWPRRTTVRRFVGRASAPLFGLQLAGSRLRGFTRPCASVNALRHTWGTRGLCTSFLRSIFFLSLCAWLARSKVIGELSSQGTSQLRGVSLPRLQAERLGLSRPPGSAAATGSLSPAAPALL